MNLYWNSFLSDNVYQKYPYVILFHTYVLQKYRQYASTPNKQHTEHNTFIYKKSKSQSHHCSLPAGSPRLISVCKILQNSLLRVAAALANAIHHFKWDHYGNVFQTQYYDATVAAVAILSTSALPEYRTLLSVSSYIFFFFTGAQSKFRPHCHQN